MTWADRRRRWHADADYREQLDREYPSADIALEIVRARADKGWTQEDLAREMGSHQSVVARLESGRRPVTNTTLARVAKALGAKYRFQFVTEPDETAAAAQPAATIPVPAAAPTANVMTERPGFVFYDFKAVNVHAVRIAGTGLVEGLETGWSDVVSFHEGWDDPQPFVAKNPAGGFVVMPQGRPAQKARVIVGHDRITAR